MKNAKAPKQIDSMGIWPDGGGVSFTVRGSDSSAIKVDLPRHEIADLIEDLIRLAYVAASHRQSGRPEALSDRPPETFSTIAPSELGLAQMDHSDSYALVLRFFDWDLTFHIDWPKLSDLRGALDAIHRSRPK